MGLFFYVVWLYYKVEGANPVHHRKKLKQELINFIGLRKRHCRSHPSSLLSKKGSWRERAFNSQVLICQTAQKKICLDFTNHTCFFWIETLASLFSSSSKVLIYLLCFFRCVLFRLRAVMSFWNFFFVEKNGGWQSVNIIVWAIGLISRISKFKF